MNDQINKQDIDLLVTQLRNILLNKPIDSSILSKHKDLEELQSGFEYLSNSLTEVNQFLAQLAQGNLDVVPPTRHSFMTGNLKEIHSGLNHLAWQTKQVAQGDYNQRVSFLGDFSVSFNSMTKQLQERETRLQEQSETLMQSNKLLQKIMDSMQDGIIVSSIETDEVLYKNASAQSLLSFLEENYVYQDSTIELIQQIKELDTDNDPQSILHLQSESTACSLLVNSFAVEWENKKSTAYFIIDVTKEFAEQSQMKKLAYQDELTGIYNRRYCLDTIKDMLLAKEHFTFCLIDVDKLKYANDSFGHIAGDTYLKTVSRLLLDSCRETDIVARIGGDEFAIVFKDCKIPLASAKLDQINDLLQKESTDYPMSFSYGIVYIDESCTYSILDLMHLADNEMYRQKYDKKMQRTD